MARLCTRSLTPRRNESRVGSGFQQGFTRFTSQKLRGNRSSFPGIVVIPTRSEAKGGTCFSFAAPVLVWDWLVWKGHSCPLPLTLILEVARVERTHSSVHAER